jgi:hypothetical protein
MIRRARGVGAGGVVDRHDVVGLLLRWLLPRNTPNAITTDAVRRFVSQQPLGTLNAISRRRRNRHRFITQRHRGFVLSVLLFTAAQRIFD